MITTTTTTPTYSNKQTTAAPYEHFSLFLARSTHDD